MTRACRFLAALTPLVRGLLRGPCAAPGGGARVRRARSRRRGGLVAIVPLLLLAGLAPRARGAELPVSISIRHLGSHDAARFLAEVYQVGVLVLGEDKPCSLELKGLGAEAALAKLAAAQGLALRKRGKLHLLAPAALVEGAAVTGLSGGRRVDLSFKLAELGALAKLLVDVAGLKLEGTLSGRVSILARNLPALDGLAALAALGSSATRREGRVVRVSARAGLPAHATTIPAACPPGESPYLVRLPCAPVAELRVGAIASRGQRAFASLFRVSGEGSGQALTVRVGDRVGRAEGDGAPRKIVAIDRNGVLLEAERRLSYP